jgi:hypothetical protein
MSVHQRIIPGLLEVCASIHPDCAVVLIGSVAQGTERPCSDLDLNLIFPGDELPQNQHPYVGDDNRWQLVVKDKIEGIRIDIAWETQQVLIDYVAGPQVRACWPFSNGRILRDPLNVAAPSLAIANQWYVDHPEVRERYERVYAEAKRRQRDARC